MSDAYYCYKIGYATPLLTDDEWAKIEPTFKEYFRRAKIYHELSKLSVRKAEEKASYARQALDMYTEITGAKLKHPDDLLFVTFSRYGSLCPTCDRPFRTPMAKICAECGYELPIGQVAGPLQSRQQK